MDLSGFEYNRLARICLITLFLGVFLSACITPPAQVCGPALSHSPLVIFGDSYSDTGNIAVDNIIEFPPPFHDGRFSNGLVAVDHLAVHLGSSAVPSKHTVGCDESGFNFAVGGGNILGNKQQDLMCQVNSYLDRVSDSAEPSALYLVIMGGNDLRSLDISLSATDASNQIDAILTHLFGELERLVSAGAIRFMIANSGDMGDLPGSLSDPDPAFSPKLSDYSAEYNTKFDIRLADFISTHAGLIVNKFDLADVMSTITHAPSVLGFTNTTQGCFDMEDDTISFHSDCLTGPIDTTCTNLDIEEDLLALAGCVARTKFDEFVFFDSVHATADAHKIIGQALIDTLP